MSTLLSGAIVSISYLTKNERMNRFRSSFLILFMTSIFSLGLGFITANWVPFYFVAEEVEASDEPLAGLHIFTQNETFIMSIEYAGYILLYLLPIWIGLTAWEAYRTNLTKG